jgi:hypothetical protein
MGEQAHLSIVNLVDCLAIARSAAITRHHIPGTIINNLPLSAAPEGGKTPGSDRVIVIRCAPPGV